MPRRRIPQALRALIITIVVGGVATGACLATLIPGANLLGSSTYFRSDKLEDLSLLAQRSTIFDNQGNVMALLGVENREPADLQEVPEILQQAVVAVEDKTFWENEGVDFNGTLRAFLKNLTEGGIVQGGSTISQQLVKNRILTSKKSVNRKVREIVLAVRLNEKFSKREILEQYLNTVYFGQGSYGVKSAVERFFLAPTGQFAFGQEVMRPKQIFEVTIGEAALLAGLISNPEGNNPFVYPDRAALRRELALENMIDEGYITEAQADAAKTEPLPTVKPVAELRPLDSWSEEVQDRLFTDPMFSVLGDTLKERQDRVLKGGLKIYPTNDPKMQDDATRAMDEGLASGKAGFTGALVAVDPRNGFVKAMVAGPGFTDSQYNIATSPIGRQAGSTWKVITLAAGLESGFSPADMVDGSSPCEFKVWGRTQNAGEGSSGMQTIRAATHKSTNCAYARMQLAVGLERTMATARKMGITQDTLKPILTLTLGAVETTPLEMATVAATIANQGVHHSPTFVSRIVAPDGEVVFDAADIPGDQAISKDAANCETDILRGVISGGGTGGNASLGGRPVAGKTGSTDNLADANFLGYTPQLATFIWHGFPDSRQPGAGFGGQIPAGIFRRFMNSALAGQPPTPFPPAGPFCARSAAFITEGGRVATFNGLLPGQAPTTLVPPTVSINPTTTTTTVPPATTTPTTSPPDGICLPGGKNPPDPDCD